MRTMVGAEDPRSRACPAEQDAAFPRTERRSLCGNAASGLRLTPCLPPRALVLDIGGRGAAQRRELVRPAARADVVGAYVAGDVAGLGRRPLAGDAARTRSPSAQYWADRAVEIGAVLGHDDWSTRQT